MTTGHGGTTITRHQFWVIGPIPMDPDLEDACAGADRYQCLCETWLSPFSHHETSVGPAQCKASLQAADVSLITDLNSGEHQAVTPPMSDIRSSHRCAGSVLTGVGHKHRPHVGKQAHKRNLGAWPNWSLASGLPASEVGRHSRLAGKVTVAHVTALVLHLQLHV
jgi:hypothetical protein